MPRFTEESPSEGEKENFGALLDLYVHQDSKVSVGVHEGLQVSQLVVNGSVARASLLQLVLKELNKAYITKTLK